MTIILITVGKNPLENGVALIVNKRVQNAVLQCNLKNNRIICFQCKPFIIIVMQVYALITNAKEAEVERFYEDLQDLLQVTPGKKKKKVFFIMGDWNAKAGRDTWSSMQVWPWSRNEAGQRLIELCKENSLVIANTHPTTGDDSTHGH